MRQDAQAVVGLGNGREQGIVGLADTYHFYGASHAAAVLVDPIAADHAANSLANCGVGRSWLSPESSAATPKCSLCQS
jgi:hypothetical protein